MERVEVPWSAGKGVIPLMLVWLVRGWGWERVERNLTFLSQCESNPSLPRLRAAVQAAWEVLATEQLLGSSTDRLVARARQVYIIELGGHEALEPYQHAERGWAALEYQRVCAQVAGVRHRRGRGQSPGDLERIRAARTRLTTQLLCSRVGPGYREPGYLTPSGTMASENLAVQCWEDLVLGHEDECEQL